MNKGCLRALALLALSVLVICLDLIFVYSLPPQWEKLPPIRSTVTDLAFSRSAIYVRTNTGSSFKLLYSPDGKPALWIGEECVENNHACRYFPLPAPCNPSLPRIYLNPGYSIDSRAEQCPIPSYPSLIVTVSGPWSCDPSVFSIWTFPPSNVKGCLQYWSRYADSSYTSASTSAFALDSKGNLWTWNYAEVNDSVIHKSGDKLPLKRAVLIGSLAIILIAGWSLSKNVQNEPKATDS